MKTPTIEVEKSKKEQIKEQKKAEKKKRASKAMLKGGAILLAAAVSIATSSLIKDKAPSDEELAAAINPPYVVEETVVLPPDPVIPKEEEQTEKSNKKSSPSFGSIAIYILGWIVSTLLFIFKGVLGVIPAKAAAICILVACIVIAIIFGLKKAFSDLTWNEIKNRIPKKPVILGVLSIAALIAFCELTIHFRAETPFVYAVYLLGGLLIILEVFSICSDFVAQKVK